GMNVNLAPVLDVYRAAGDFDDQFGRSYSKDPAKVSYLGADFIKTQQATGVAATAKHFPGLGKATSSQNTDAGPVTLNVTLNPLHQTEGQPGPAGPERPGDRARQRHAGQERVHRRGDADRRTALQPRLGRAREHALTARPDQAA